MRSLLTLMVVGLMGLPLFAQPAVEWLSGGIGPNPDDVTSVAVAPSGDVFMGGTFSDSITFGGKTTIQAYNNYDVFLSRYNASGKVQLAINYGGLDLDESNSIAVDNKGNIYVTGAFTDQMLIGDTTLETIDNASVDIFVAKFDRMGAFLWAKVFGSPNYDESGPYVAIDSTGNVYLTGIFGGTAEFDSKTVTSDGEADMFLAKLNSSGTTQWVKKVGGTKQDRGTGIGISKDGTRIYVVGTFEGVVRFDATEVTSFNSKPDFFVMSYDQTGVIKWWHRIGTPDLDAGISCVVDKNDQLVIAGSFKGAMSWLDDTPPMNSNGDLASDMFVAKYTNLGAYVWQRKFGGVLEDHVHAVSVDKNNNLYVAGYFDSTTVFAENVIESAGGRDAVMIKLSPDGIYDWLVQGSGPYDDEFKAVALDVNNNAVVAGVFDTRITLGDSTLQGQRFSDVFVAKFKCGPNTLFIPPVTRIDMCQGADTAMRVKDGYPGYQWYDNGKAITGAIRSRYPLDGLSTGVHKIKVQVTGYDGCLGYSVEVTVAVADGMAKPKITKDGTNLTVDIAGAKEYYWTREGRPTTANGTQTIALEGTGLYRVRVTDTSGCTRWSDVYLNGTTDVAESTIDDGVRLRPNPAFETLTIETGGDAQVRIMDMVGKTLYADRVETSTVLPLATFSPGMYTVLISRGNSVLHRTFIKQ